MNIHLRKFRYIYLYGRFYEELERLSATNHYVINYYAMSYKEKGNAILQVPNANIVGAVEKNKSWGEKLFMCL